MALSTLSSYASLPSNIRIHLQNIFAEWMNVYYWMNEWMSIILELFQHGILMLQHFTSNFRVGK